MPKPWLTPRWPMPTIRSPPEPRSEHVTKGSARHWQVVLIFRASHILEGLLDTSNSRIDRPGALSNAAIQTHAYRSASRRGRMRRQYTNVWMSSSPKMTNAAS